MTERRKREGAKRSKGASNASAKGSKRPRRRKLSPKGTNLSDTCLRVFVDAIPCVVLVLAPDGRIIEFNRQAERLYGRRREEVIGQDYYTLFLPEEAREHVAADIRKVLSGESTRGYENPIRDASGNERLFEWHVDRFEDDQGELVGIIAVGLDVSERARTAAVLRASEKSYEEILNAASDAIFVHDANTGAILDVNEAVLEMMGYTRDEILGLSIGDLSSGQPPHSQREAVQWVQKTATEGPQLFEWVAKRKNGELFWCEVSLKSAVIGGQQRIIAATRDISERKEAERKLLEEKQFSDAAINEMPGVFYLFDQEGHLERWNENLERISGYTAEEIGRMHPIEFFRGQDKDTIARTILETFERGASSVEAELVTKDGRGISHYFTGLRITRGGNNYLLGLGIDISERREAQRRIETLNTLEESLLAPGTIEEKAKRLTDGVVEIFNADFARIWLAKPGDRCDRGCPHADVTEGPHVCRIRNRCLHLVASSGRYTHLDGKRHARVPYGCYKIGLVAATQDAEFVTNDVEHDERVHDHAWARRLGLVSFAGYRLMSPDGSPMGVLALFAKHPLSPDETRLLGTVAGIASQAIETARTEDERKRLTAILERTSDLVAIATPDGRVTYMNQAGRDLLGWGGDVDLLATRIPDAHPEWAAERVVEEALPTAAREGVWFGETALLRADGEEIPVSQVVVGHPGEDGAPAYFSTIMRDISARKRAEVERIAHVRFLENLEQIEAAIRGASDVEGMLWGAMEAMRSAFGSDRAWLIHPCDPNARTFRVPVEVALPEYPGLFSLDLEIAMEGGVGELCAAALAFDGPMACGPGEDHPLTKEAADRFEVRSQLVMAVHPKAGGPWLVGLHQCAAPRVWTDEEKHLFREMAGRVRDALSSLLLFRDLREREARLESIFRAAPVGIGLVAGRIITQVNQRICDTLGRSREELIGQSTRILFASDEEYERVGREIYGQLAEQGLGAMEAQYARKDGTIVDVLLNATPLDPGDPETDVTFVALDITERKHAEERESDARRVAEAVAAAGVRYLETARIQDMAELIVERALDIIGGELGFVGERTAEGSLNLLAISGAAWRAFVGSRLHREAHEAIERGGGFVVPRSENTLYRCLDEGEILVSNDPSTHRDWRGGPLGHPAIQSVLLVPLMAAQEVVGLIGVGNRPGGFSEVERRELEAFAPTAALAISRRRSEQERLVLEDQLVQSQKMEAIGQLAGGVAHDFNNLLQAILGYVSLAMNGLPPEDVRYGYLAEVTKASERAASLTQQLLAFSRRQVIQPKAIDLNHTISDLIRMLRRVIGEQIELNVMLGERLKPVYADAGQLGQVLINLCVNARDAMPDGGRLTIETRNADAEPAPAREQRDATWGEHVLFSVSDTGMGMKTEVLEHVFEPFFTTKAPGKGTGLGLATVYGIVKQHHGTITVESEVGKGTSFSVLLPASLEAPEADEEGWSEQLAIGSETILLAEDEEVVRKLALEVLQGAGYTVLVARDGKEAVEVFRDHMDEVNLVLLDAVMPRMNGRTAFEEMRALRPNLPALFCSGYSFSMLGKDFLEKTGARTISKPYTVTDLLRNVREALG